MQHQIPPHDYGMYHKTPPFTHLAFQITKYMENVRPLTGSFQVVVFVSKLIMVASFKYLRKLQNSWNSVAYYCTLSCITLLLVWNYGSECNLPKRALQLLQFQVISLPQHWVATSPDLITFYWPKDNCWVMALRFSTACLKMEPYKNSKLAQWMLLKARLHKNKSMKQQPVW